MTSSPTTSTNQLEAHFEDLLKKTSRSFYLSLKILPSNTRSPMALGYALCRMADTIADTDLIPDPNRLRLLNAFDGLFVDFPFDSTKVDAFTEQLNDLDIDRVSPEGRLLTSHEVCFSLFKKLGRTQQALIQRVVRAVIRGMKMDLSTFAESGDTVNAFENDETLEDYLLLIGGEPGRFWTALTLLSSSRLYHTEQDEWMKKGIQFGKGLQMINILRDLPQDLRRGRCYFPRTRLYDAGLRERDLLDKNNIGKFLPLYQTAIDQTLDRLQNGLAVLKDIPFWDLRQRAAVWWPLYIGLKTLGKLRNIANILDEKSPVKIKRSEIKAMIVMSFWTVPFQRFLRWEFEFLAGAATSSMAGGYKVN